MNTCIRSPAQTNGNSMQLWSTIKFETNSVVSATDSIWVFPIIGGVLPVPPSTCAVLTFRSGRRKVFTEGIHRLGHGFPAGPYPVRYVDVKLQRTPIPFTAALCKDGWRGGLALEVHWRVGDATLIVDVSDPIGNLIIAAKACVRAVIETLLHDELIGGMRQVMDADTLANEVTARLNGAVQGIQILKTLITERQGDERRVQIVQAVTVERTRVFEEQELNRQKLAGEATLVSQQMELEQKRQDLVLLEAETKRKQVEEERKVRIREAEIEAEVSECLIPTKWRQVQLDMAVETNRQRHEQALKVIDAHAQVLTETAKLGQIEGWGISSRRRPEFEFGGVEAALSQGLHNLQSVIQHPRLMSGSEDTNQTDGRKSLIARLVDEVAEISQLDGIQCCRLEMATGESVCRVVIEFDNRVLGIVCYPGYPTVAPEVRWSDNGQQEVPIVWSEGMSLKNILQAI